MTLDHLATFAESSDGKVYRDVCERFGVDPGAALGDDFMAWQLRLALVVAHPYESSDATEPEVDPFAAAREAAAKVRAMT